MSNFKATHVIMTQANKAGTNGVLHCFKFGTEVMWVKAQHGYIKVVNANGSLQFVQLSDLRVATENV
jgi:hypothetical protein